jgi:hypothetical protein
MRRVHGARTKQTLANASKCAHATFVKVHEGHQGCMRGAALFGLNRHTPVAPASHSHRFSVTSLPWYADQVYQASSASAWVTRDMSASLSIPSTSCAALGCCAGSCDRHCTSEERARSRQKSCRLIAASSGSSSHGYYAAPAAHGVKTWLMSERLMEHQLEGGHVR